MFRVTRYPMISKTESGRVGYRKKYRVAGRVWVPTGHCSELTPHGQQAPQSTRLIKALQCTVDKDKTTQLLCAIYHSFTHLLDLSQKYAIWKPSTLDDKIAQIGHYRLVWNTFCKKIFKRDFIALKMKLSYSPVYAKDSCHKTQVRGVDFL